MSSTNVHTLVPPSEDPVSRPRRPSLQFLEEHYPEDWKDFDVLNPFEGCLIDPAGGGSEAGRQLHFGGPVLGHIDADSCK